MPPAAKRKAAPTAAAQPSLRAFFSSRADNGVVAALPAHAAEGSSPQKPRSVPRSPSSSSSFGGRTLTQEEQDLARAIAASLADVVQEPQREPAQPPFEPQPAATRMSPGESGATELRSEAGPSRSLKPLFMGTISDDDDIVDDGPDEARTSVAPQAEIAASGPSRLAPSTSGAAAKPNAFARLMAPASDALQWAGADAVEQNNYKGAGRTRRAARTAPFYKILEGMPICVDGFRFGKIHGCTAYFLSHFHSDHYIGLSKAWTHGPVYCSAETASLVRSSLYVPPEFVVALPFDEPFEVPNTGGVIVTPISANHCPGSALFHFRGRQTRHILPPPPGGHHPALRKGTSTYLHCGDFRACPAHVEHPAVKAHKLDIIYLDTTYCNARYCFPPQPLVVEACGELVSKLAPSQCSGPDVGTEGPEQWRDRAPTKREAAAKKTEASDSLARKAMQGWLQPEAEAGPSNIASPLRIKDEPLVKDEPLLDDEEDAWQAAHADVDGGFRDEIDRDELDEDAEAMYNEALDDPERPGEEALWRVKDEPVDEEEERKPLARGDVKPAASTGASAASGSTPAPLRSAFDMLGKSYAETFPEATTRGRLLVVVGTYTIGKEKIVLSCARALRSKVYCADPRKYRVYAQLDEPELHARLTRNPLEASVHVTGLRMINGEALRQHVASMRKLGADWQRAVAFRPTGWSYRPPAGIDTVSPALDRVIEVNQATGFDASGLQPTRDSTSEFRIYGVPYSEHSSFFELSAFALSVDYDRIIATVNVGSPQSRAKMAKWFERWKAERKRRNFVPITPRASTYF